MRDNDNVQDEQTFSWTMTCPRLRLMLDIARFHLEHPVPRWLADLEPVVLEEHHHGLVHDAKMTDRQALEYHDFVWHLYQKTSAWYGSHLADTLFEDELGSLQHELSDRLEERDAQRSGHVRPNIKKLLAGLAAKKAA